MATLRPFRAIRYTVGRDLSAHIAPPYDVLDDAAKARLLERSANNIVAIDLPFTPPKALGPQSVYEQAGQRYRQWLEQGLLKQDVRTAFYPYEQRFEYGGRQRTRRGFFALVRLTAFGKDVIPHEKTYPGPIEDRLRLMQETSAQLSPVFGLYYDEQDAVAKGLFAHVAQPDHEANVDGVRHLLWHVFDSAVEQRVMDLFVDKKVYIADGHHRYTTALHYQQRASRDGGLPPEHPANYCLMVLVNAADPELLILPTHRLVGGLASWDVEAFFRYIEPHFEVTRTPLRPDHVDELALTLPGFGSGAIGVYDGAGRSLSVIRPRDPSLMARLEPTRSPAWRSLDVSVLQRYIFDEVLARFGGELARGYTADSRQAGVRVDLGEFQAAFLLQPTPITALRDLGGHGEVMPQKSTYFFPKLATGLVVAPL